MMQKSVGQPKRESASLAGTAFSLTRALIGDFFLAFSMFFTLMNNGQERTLFGRGLQQPIKAKVIEIAVPAKL